MRDQGVLANWRRSLLYFPRIQFPIVPLPSWMTITMKIKIKIVETMNKLFKKLHIHCLFASILNLAPLPAFKISKMKNCLKIRTLRSPSGGTQNGVGLKLLKPKVLLAFRQPNRLRRSKMLVWTRHQRTRQLSKTFCALCQGVPDRYLLVSKIGRGKT